MSAKIHESKQVVPPWVLAPSPWWAQVQSRAWLNHQVQNPSSPPSPQTTKMGPNGSQNASIPANMVPPIPNNSTLHLSRTQERSQNDFETHPLPTLNPPALQNIPKTTPNVRAPQKLNPPATQTTNISTNDPTLHLLSRLGQLFFCAIPKGNQRI